MYNKGLIYVVFLLFNLLLLSELNAQVYFLNGNAQFIGGDCYQLTAAINTQNGTVWYGEQIDLEQTFDLSFSMNFGNQDMNGADGICFVLQTVGTAAIGESGGGLGYLNFGTSLGIEFDTYQNGDYGDPAYDHIAIERDGDLNHNSLNNIAGPIQADVFDANIEDGEDHIVRITWDPETQEMDVFFDCTFRLTGQIDLVNDIFGGESEVYWGFTAATGGLNNSQIVCLQENIVTSSQDVSICNGASTVLSAGSSIDGVYNWSPSNYLDITDQAIVNANPPVSTTYYVEFIDLCGDSNTYEFNVIVEEMEVSVGDIQELTCLNVYTAAIADINFPGDPTYSWYFDDQLILTGENFDQALYDSPGPAYVIANIQGVCLDTLNFEIIANYDTFLADAGEDLVINCFNPSWEISGQSNSPQAQFLWADTNGSLSPGPDITIDEAGTYGLMVVNPENGCESMDEIEVIADFELPSIDFPDQDTLSCLTPAVQILMNLQGSSGDFTASWTTEDGAFESGANSLSPSVIEPGIYNVEVADLQNGCTSQATVEIEEDGELNFDLSNIEFPNVLTPNGKDGNEIWQPFLTDDPQKDIAFVFEEFDLKVYNRWGKLVFESESSKNPWKATDLSEGVYFYHFRYKAFCSNGSNTDREGWIHLMR
ncbi:MAG: lectin-like domain-containing protein [Flavobacteriales bacterium]